MRRVAVVGCSGAGKTTFSRRLAAVTGLPLVHLDEQFWLPGWQERDRADWLALQRRLFAAEEWIADGNYGASLELRLRRADTVVFFDFPRRICLRRVLWRVLRDHGRATQAPGCPERLDLAFLRYVWRFPRRSRPAVLAALAEHAAHADVHVLRSPREAERALATLARAA